MKSSSRSDILGQLQRKSPGPNGTTTLGAESPRTPTSLPLPRRVGGASSPESRNRSRENPEFEPFFFWPTDENFAKSVSGSLRALFILLFVLRLVGVWKCQKICETRFLRVGVGRLRKALREMYKNKYSTFFFKITQFVIFQTCRF